MKKILIAGAGIGGLTVGLALLRQGFDVEIYEQARNLGEVGAGLQLAANGTRVLRALGLFPAMQQVISPVEGKELRLWSTGQAWPLFDLGVESEARYGAPYWMVHRGDFHAVLLDAVRAACPGAVRIGTSCTGYDQDAREIRLHLASGETVHGDALIGADGVHSMIRQQMAGVGRARFTGLMAWRGLVPMHCLPPAQRRLVSANWVGVGGHVVTYPLRRGEILNFVGVIERADWRLESWTEPGSREECARDLQGWHEEVQTIIRNIATPFKWALLGREPLEHFSQGRVTLLGDAAHPTLPFLAQGANMTLEDAAVLTRCLAADGDVTAALQRYEKARLPRTAAIVRGADDNTKRFHNPAHATAEGAASYVAREFQPDLVRRRYEWLFEYDALTVAI